jgi:hypothetical protein
MLEIFKKPKEKSTKDKVIDWLNTVAKRQPQLTKEIELVIYYWKQSDFKNQKYLQVAIPNHFTEWLGRVELIAHYETEKGLKPCTMFNAVRLIDENITPIAIHFDCSYMQDGLLFTRTITMSSDVQTLLDASRESDVYKQKAALTLHYLTAIFAAKIVRHQFLIERRKS